MNKLNKIRSTRLTDDRLYFDPEWYEQQITEGNNNDGIVHCDTSKSDSEEKD